MVFIRPIDIVGEIHQCQAHESLFKPEVEKTILKGNYKCISWKKWSLAS